jgi:hypothetical protein
MKKNITGNDQDPVYPPHFLRLKSDDNPGVIKKAFLLKIVDGVISIRAGHREDEG